MPLTFRLAAVIVTLLAALAYWHWEIDLRMMRKEVQQRAVERALYEMDQLQGALEFALQSRAMDQVRLALSAPAADLSVQLLAVTDDLDRVLASTAKQQVDRPLFEAARSYPGKLEALAPMMIKARATGLGQVQLSADGRKVFAVYPLVLPAAASELRTFRRGLVVLVRDLDPALADAKNWSTRSALLVAAAGLTIASTALVFAHVVNQRVRRLVGAARNFADGDLSARAEISGSDEIALVGNAFDNMAEKVADTQRSLQRESNRLQVGAALSTDVLYEWDIRTGRVELFGEFSAGSGARLLTQSHSFASFRDRLHPADRARVLDAIQRHLSEGSPFDVMYRIEEPDGKVTIWRDRGRAIRDVNNQPSRFIGAATDITDKQLAEENALREHLFTETCINALPGVFYLLNRHGEFLRWNRNLIAISGYCEEELLKMRPLDFFEPSEHERVAASFERTFQEGSATLETICRTKDGRLIPFFFTGHRLIMEGEAFVVGVGVDVAERKQAEAARAELETQLARAQKLEAIGTVAGGIAHDFNNILTAILGNAELAQLEVAEDHPAQENLAEVVSAADRGRAMVREIITFGRRKEAAPAPLAPAPVLAQAGKLLRNSLPAMITVDVSSSENAPMVVADATKLHQVLMNLGQNAAHAMARDGGVLGIAADRATLKEMLTTSFGSLPPGEYLRLTVRDTGSGMSSETKSHIFDPFFTTKAPGHGTGLGLQVVLGVVRELGGAISVESQLGRGTTFEILLPAAQATSGSGPQQVLECAHRRVLLVDDDSALVDISGRTLERAGWKVTRCGCAAEALDHFQADPDAWDLVITDRNMPDMSGFQLAETMITERPDISIVLATGYNDETSREQAQALGIEHVLMKPYLPRALLDIAQKACAA